MVALGIILFVLCVLLLLVLIVRDFHRQTKEKENKHD